MGYDNERHECQNECPDTVQTHVHEFEESTKLAEQGNERHNHRVAGVTGEVIPIGGGRHVHPYSTNTDFFDHHHEIGGTTGPDIPIPNTNKHIHVIYGRTTCNDGHTHDYLFTTQINSPLI
ncbi:YmaF family protein [Clostridium paridis]|uniref:YmaF family protein n=1 Tax=Clostridium paridis TaxID=2803863 RepID=A0A937K3U4_9CLOT|nr:YmaF family protein [Clostridium paridis]MBL4931962.1 YmaF family protein [Clostridium paridis]